MTAITAGLLAISTVPVVAQSAEPTGPAALTLSLAIANGQGEPSQPAVDAFIQQVSELSDGALAIEPFYDAGNATEEGFEQGVALLVERGEVDLGLSASRAWDLAGVTSLQALQAPFLITDGDLAAAVATSDIAERALAGMADQGVVGLTLWPEDLRHPFAFDAQKPYLGPDDFAGSTILVQPSALSRSLVTTLGGTLYQDGDREADVAAGILQGAESGLLQGHTLPGHPTATGDVTFYPKFQVISANGERFEALTAEQQEVLRAAAAATQGLTMAASTSEADAAEAWCANGGTIALAGEAGIADFEAAAAPLYDQIEQDPLTAELIADIRALKATTEPAAPTVACGPAAASPAPASSPVAGVMELDTDRPGQDIDDFDLRTADPALCDQACRENPDCKAWTYVKPNTTQGPDARCWLKDGVPQPEPASCCVSGVNSAVAALPSPGMSPPVADVLELVSTWDASTIPGLAYPSGMDVAADGSLLVVNGGAGEIPVLDAAGTDMRRFGEPGSGDGQLDFVRDKSDPGSAIGGVAITPDGSIYVADAANRRVQQFDAEGGYVRQWGSYAFSTAPGTFIDPIDIAAAPDGSVYVVDDQRDDIQRFSGDGTHLETIGEHGTGDGQLNFTGAVFVDAAGTLYNADWENDRVQAWGPDSSFAWSLGSHGSGPGEFTLPGDVGVDSDGTIYVADRHRVQVFGPDRVFIGEWVAPGTTTIDELSAISVGRDGTVYVGAPWRGQIYVLRATDALNSP
jgi:TRAP-type C4-dicarboxylate transport system substrate-binding protein